MRITLQQGLSSALALLVTVAVVLYFNRNAAAIGSAPMLVRALLLSLAVIAGLVTVYPFNPLFRGRPQAYALAVCLPALLPGFLYFLVLLPQQAGTGLAAEQLRSQLITDSSSNGIIEVGFQYPIYTPTVSITNRELYTRPVNVFLRMTDANGDNALFRAVRVRVPGSALSVEATVQGMLSENREFLFNPLQLPPRRSVAGRVVFIISNLDDGTTFVDALGRAYQAQFELRDPETGELLLEFPLSHI